MGSEGREHPSQEVNFSRVHPHPPSAKRGGALFSCPLIRGQKFLIFFFLLLPSLNFEMQIFAPT